MTDARGRREVGGADLGEEGCGSGGGGEEVRDGESGGGEEGENGEEGEREPHRGIFGGCWECATMGMGKEKPIAASGGFMYLPLEVSKLQQTVRYRTEDLRGSKRPPIRADGFLPQHPAWAEGYPDARNEPRPSTTHQTSRPDPPPPQPAPQDGHSTTYPHSTCPRSAAPSLQAKKTCRTLLRTRPPTSASGAGPRKKRTHDGGINSSARNAIRHNPNRPGTGLNERSTGKTAEPGWGKANSEKEKWRYIHCCQRVARPSRRGHKARLL